MFNFIKRKKSANDLATAAEKKSLDPNAAQENTEVAAEVKKSSWFTRLKSGLSKTRNQLSNGLGTLLLGKKTLDAALFEELETLLISADVGIDATETIIAKLTEQVDRRQCQDGDALYAALQTHLKAMLKPADAPLTLTKEANPTVILVVGVNGNGKTTTIGKMAHYYQAQGKKVMLAAADTFRAAAIEQLQVWGERNDIPVIAQQHGADSASVAYDALSSAKARDIDILFIDTAGRLHTQANLMEELKKIKRVLNKLDDSTPHETLLVIDAGTGQNALKQVEMFHQAIGLNGLAMTKLDGTAKAGILFAITQQFQLPVRFIGVGEGIDDLRPFHVDPFVDALFSTNATTND